MKNLLLCFIMTLILGSCARQQASKIDGAWNLVSFQMVTHDTMVNYFPGTWKGGLFKIWSKDHYSYSGFFESDTAIVGDAYGGGTFTLKGKLYNETILYYGDKTQVGKTFRFLHEMKNDTMIHTSLKDDGTLDSSNYSISRYVKY